MKLIDYILTDLLKNDVEHLVTSSSILLNTICDKTILKDFTISQICDERSVGYVAIGMYEETEQPIAIIVEESKMRNLAPAVTEAYYRKFPLIVISLADRNLNNSQYPRDMFKRVYSIIPKTLLNNSKIVQTAVSLSNSNGGTPVLLCVYEYEKNINNKELGMQQPSLIYDIPNTCVELETVVRIIQSFDDVNVVFYIDKKYVCQDLLCLNIKGKIEYNKGILSTEGLLSIMIGASLVAHNKHFVYIGLSNSAIYDINALGNRHISNNLSICLLGKNDDTDLIKHTCETWKYNLFTESIDTLYSISMRLNNEKVTKPSIIEIS